MATKNHDYHILPPSPWPISISLSVFIMAVGGVMWMHEYAAGGLTFFIGLTGVLAILYCWWSDVVREAHKGDHTPVVQLHMRYGMILFIAYEVMFFVGWFWAFFDFALFPSALAPIEGQFPSKGIEVIDPFELPLLNTMILLCSGTTLTWAHHALINGNRDGLKKGLWCTVLLGGLFLAIQAYEYSHAPFPFGETPYSSAFYMATGFHGFHVLVGVIFLTVNLVRAYKGHFTARQHFGFEAAAWYWHFVDVVWLFLFCAIYVWGGWGAPVHGG